MIAVFLALALQVVSPVPAASPTPVATPTPEPAPTPETAPIPVVERTVTLRDRAVRVSLFSDRVAVVSIRDRGIQVWVGRLTLDEPVYMAYLIAVQRDAAALAEERGQLQDEAQSVGATAVIDLHVGDAGRRRIAYSPVAVLDLAMGRLVRTLDDIQSTVLEADPAQEALRNWEPKLGEVVELLNGRLAEITDVREDGSLVIEHLETPMIEVVPAASRTDVILRVVRERR
jgi:hypothetical protein